MAPAIQRVALLWNVSNPTKARDVQEAQDTARSLGLQILSFEVRKIDDFEGAFHAIASSRADAMMTLQDPLSAAQSTRIAAFAVEQRLPAIYEVRLWTEAGGLMHYGIDSVELFHRAATYVDKLLKGAKPADLPVEQPTKFELMINLKTAQTMGLTIPQSVLQQASATIQ